MLIEGVVTNSTETGFWNGVTVDFSSPLDLTYRNNSVTSENSVGYILNFGIEGDGSNSEHLNGMIISGNKFTWNGDINNSITHGIFTGYQKDCDIKYNYLDTIPYGMVIKSGVPGPPASSLTYISGGVSYNIIKDSRLGVLLKGMNGVKINNNTFYTSRVDLNFGLIDVSPNEDNNMYAPSTGTTIFNNIFYSVNSTMNIRVWGLYNCDEGFQCDYNVYYCENGEPLFDELGYRDGTNHPYLTFSQWQALGYDLHSVVINPNFVDTINFVPTAPLTYATNLGASFDTGISTNATWITGSTPATQTQGTIWQNGAIILSSGATTGNTYYVSTTGNDNNSGTINSPFFTLNKAWEVVTSGDTIYMRGGTYTYNTQQVIINKNGVYGNTIKIFAYPGESPNITKGGSYTYDDTYGYGCYISGNYIHVKGIRISYFTQENEFVWHGLRAENVNNCIFEQLTIDHNGSGFIINSNSTGNLVLNCDSHHNRDPLSPIPYNNGDGLGCNYIPYGNTNTYRNCRSWFNADDGFDLFRNEGNAILESCWSFNNGYSDDSFTPSSGSNGDGTGFKLGDQFESHSAQTLRTITNCVAYYNRTQGFDENALQCLVTIYNCTSYQNGRIGFSLNGYPHTISNCLGYINGTYNAIPDLDATLSHNTFLYGGDENPAYTVTNADFISLNSTGIDGARQSDGSLPVITFLHLAPGSDLINTGINVGLPYTGSAPDLGAFESEFNNIYYVSTTGNDITGSGTISNPWFSLNKAWTYVVSGNTIYMRGGTYAYDNQQVLIGKNGTAENLINIWNYPNEIPNITKSGSYTYDDTYLYGCYLSGDYIYLKGIEISYFTQATSGVWTGLYVANSNHCKFEMLNSHHNGHGMMLGGNSTDNLILNCDFHHNQDPLSPSAYNNGDGIEFPQISAGTTNTIRGCRMYWNTDDGLDTWANEGNVIIDNCWSFYNGFIPDTFTPTGGSDGDGNGYKLGSQYVDHSSVVLRTVTNSIAYRNRREGFGIQDAKCRMNIYNNTAYLNGSFGLVFVDYAHTIRNNIAYQNSGSYEAYTTNSTVDHNTFLANGDPNPSYSISNADFISLDPTGIDGARQSDGSLPIISFLHLSAGSDLINTGVDVGLPYSETSPDLGAFESDFPNNTYYVSTTGSDSNPGTISQPFATLQKLNDVLVSGDTAYIRGGTYTGATSDTYYQTRWHNLTGTALNPIKIHAYSGETPIFDYVGHNFGTATKYLVQMYECDYVHIKGLTFTNAAQPATSPIVGFNMTNSNHNTLENITLSHIGGFGFSIGNTGWGTADLNTANSEYNTYLNCDAFDCEDPTSPEPYGGANGFNIVHNEGVANAYANYTTFRGCRAWNCSDDGFDLFGSESTNILIDNCWSFNNGYNSETGLHTGDGVGFKLGPTTNVSFNNQHLITVQNCVAVGNYHIGFDQNTIDKTSTIWLYNNLAYNNGWAGFYFEYLNGIAHIFKNNLSYLNQSLFGTGTVHDHNTWDSSVTVTAGDFLSLDSDQLDNARKADGSLPVITFGNLTSGSDLINAGVDVGLTYIGSAPDIGAFEYDGSIYFDSINGNDSWSGTTEYPYKSLTKLNTVLGTVATGTTIYLKRGSEWYGGPTIYPTKSGSVTNRITIDAYGVGNKPLLSGFQTLTGWTQSGTTNIWYKNITVQSQPNIVTIDGINTAKGRYPKSYTTNGGYLTLEAYTGNTVIYDSSLTNTPNWTGSEIVLRVNTWSISKGTVTNHTNSTVTYSGSAGGPDRVGLGYFFQNDIKCVTEFGDWFYTGGTFYMNFSGSTPTNHTVKVSVLDEIIYLNYRYYLPNQGENYNLKNLSIEGGNLYGIHLNSGTSITVENCDVNFTGGVGIMNFGFTKDSHFISNTVNNSNDQGIEVIAIDPIIRGNYISNTGLLPGMTSYGGETGIELGANTGTHSGALIEYNTIINSGDNGIQLRGNDNIIRNNFISHFALTVDDAGGIYSSGLNNLNEKIYDNIILYGIGNRNGLTSAGSASEGIYMDSVTRDKEIIGNTVAHCGAAGIRLHDSFDILITGNTLFNNNRGIQSVKGINNVLYGRDIIINNNIAVAKTTTQLTFHIYNYVSESPLLFGSSDYNIYARPILDTLTIETQTSAAGGGTNTKYTLATWQTTGNDTHSTKSPIAITNVNQILFEYNSGLTNRTVQLNGAYKDLYGNSVGNSITIEPFKSIILIQIINKIFFTKGGKIMIRNGKLIAK